MPMNDMQNTIDACFPTSQGKSLRGIAAKYDKTKRRQPITPVLMSASANEFSTPVESASSIRSEVIDIGSGRNVKVVICGKSYRHRTDSLPYPIPTPLVSTVELSASDTNASRMPEFGLERITSGI